MPRSSSSFDRRKILLYVAIVTVIFGGFYWSDTKDKMLAGDQVERAVDVNAFLLAQCKRDDFNSKIIIGALQDAKRRAQLSIKNPYQRFYEVGKIQYSIDQVKSQLGDCAKTLPKVQS
jgi:hypothetical protein